MSNRDNHAPRDTSTGKVNEDSIEQFLTENFSDSGRGSGEPILEVD